MRIHSLAHEHAHSCDLAWRVIDAKGMFCVGLRDLLIALGNNYTGLEWFLLLILNTLQKMFF